MLTLKSCLVLYNTRLDQFCYKAFELKILMNLAEQLCLRSRVLTNVTSFACCVCSFSPAGEKWRHSVAAYCKYQLNFAGHT